MQISNDFVLPVKSKSLDSDEASDESANVNVNKSNIAWAAHSASYNGASIAAGTHSKYLSLCFACITV